MCIAKKPYIFAIYQGGGDRTLCPPSESAHVENLFFFMFHIIHYKS